MLMMLCFLFLAVTLVCPRRPRGQEKKKGALKPLTFLPGALQRWPCAEASSALYAASALPPPNSPVAPTHCKRSSEDVRNLPLPSVVNRHQPKLGWGQLGVELASPNAFPFDLCDAVEVVERGGIEDPEPGVGNTFTVSRQEPG